MARLSSASIWDCRARIREGARSADCWPTSFNTPSIAAPMRTLRLEIPEQLRKGHVEAYSQDFH